MTTASSLDPEQLDQLESIAGMTLLTMGLGQEHADKEKKNDLSRQE